MATFCHNFFFPVYTAPFQWWLLIYIGKNLWRRVLEANKKQVPLKSYSLKIRIGSVNQILKNKEKVTITCNINILTRITDLKIVCIYLCLPNDSLHQLKIFFGSLSNAKLKGSAHVLLGKGSGKIWTFLAEIKVTL